MPDDVKRVLVIRDLDQDTLDALATRAASNGRTLEEEAAEAVRHALAPGLRRARFGLAPDLTEQEIQAAWAEFNRRSDLALLEKEGRDLGPPSEMLIREMRDRGYSNWPD